MEYRTTDVRPFSVRVILLLVAGSAFCPLKARQTNALVHVFLRWNSMPRMLLAAIFLSLCCFHYPAGSVMPQTTVYNQKFSCAPPRLDQPYSKALQGLLHFFQQQSSRESRPWWRCAVETFWTLSGPLAVLFVFARQLALNAARIPWAHHLPWGNSVAYHVTFYFWWTCNTRGGGVERWVWGLRSEVWVFQVWIY